MSWLARGPSRSYICTPAATALQFIRPSAPQSRCRSGDPPERTPASGSSGTPTPAGPASQASAPTSACHRRWPTRSTAQFSRLNSTAENLASEPSRECSPCPRYRTLLPSRCGRRPEGIAWRQLCRFVLRRWPIRTWIDDARLAVSAGKPLHKASYPIRVTYTGPSAQDRRADGRPS
jgi:hypothetical protein